MPAIEVSGLCKTYRVYRKREGLWASVAGLFPREYKVGQFDAAVHRRGPRCRRNNRLPGGIAIS